MGQHRADGPSRPTPELLAAFLDGELDLAGQRAVEAWLAEHPEERSDLDQFRSLQQLWMDTAPAEPGEEVWAGVLARVVEGVANAKPQLTVQRGRRVAGLTWLAVALTAAAALLLAFWPETTPPTVRQPVAVLPVMEADDVQILSMDAGDASALIVGEPPLRGAIVMASAKDVIVHASGPDVEVVMPDEMDQESLAWPLVLVLPEPDRDP